MNYTPARPVLRPPGRMGSPKLAGFPGDRPAGGWDGRILTFTFPYRPDVL